MKKLCVKLVIYKYYTEMHGQQKITKMQVTLVILSKFVSSSKIPNTSQILISYFPSIRYIVFTEEYNMVNSDELIFVNNQLDAQFFFSCMFISVLYMFRAAMCPSSRELIVSIRHLVYVTVYR